jgi:cytochrome c-type biogenesis protein CcmE
MDRPLEAPTRGDGAAVERRGGSKLIIGGVIIGATVIALVAWAMTRPGSTAFYLTTSEVTARGPSSGPQPYRVNGNVVPGSVRRDGLETTFTITDGKTQVVVHTDRPLPDAFRDDADTEVVALGSYDGRVFSATEVLAKCPSKFKAKA